MKRLFIRAHWWTMAEINKGETLTVRGLLEALASSAVDPDAPVLAGTLDLHGYLQNITNVKLHRESGAVVLNSGKHAGCANEEEVLNEELTDLP